MNKEARTIYLIRQVQLASGNALQERMQSVGLTAGQYTAMSMLGHRGELSSAALARKLNITPQSMNEVIATLGQKKLVSREEALDNRRVLLVRLTVAGRRQLDACDEMVNKLEEEFLGCLSGKELTAIRVALLKLLDNARAQPAIEA
jgi:DNA-binding MarR family transcriptional regulator